MQWPETGVSGQPGANARVAVEEHRTGGGFVMTLLLVMEDRTVQEKTARRKNALNVQTGILLKVQKIAIHM